MLIMRVPCDVLSLRDPVCEHLTDQLASSRCHGAFLGTVGKGLYCRSMHAYGHVRWVEQAGCALAFMRSGARSLLDHVYCAGTLVAGAWE